MSDHVHKFRVVMKRRLAPTVKLVEILAPEIAEKAKPGQFVIIRLDEKGERIPLTLVEWKPENGVITLVFQEVGVSTKKFGSLEAGDAVRDVVGPLGRPSEIQKFGSVAVVAGGVGSAPLYPIARALKGVGNNVVSIVGARTANLLILKSEIGEVSDELHITTDDGSEGFKGFVSYALRMLLEKGYSFDLVYAIGPTLMMRAVSDVTKLWGIKTVVSLNPIMVDGTGMCGGCRVSVGGDTKFVCMDGPEFDGHQVNFDELLSRQRVYLDEEKEALLRFERNQGD